MKGKQMQLTFKEYAAAMLYFLFEVSADGSSGLARAGRFNDLIELYEEMQEDGVKPQCDIFMAVRKMSYYADTGTASYRLQKSRRHEQSAQAVRTDAGNFVV